MQQLKKRGLQLICVLFTLIFAKLYFDILVDFVSYQPVKTGIVKCLILALFIVLIAMIYKGLVKIKVFLEKFQWLILGMVFVFILGMQLFLGNQLRITPLYDFSSLYDGAVSWLVQGSFPQFYEYYYYYPNNLGGMTLLMLCFYFATKLGISDYYMVAMVLNCLLCTGMIVCVFLAIRKLFSHVEAIMALILFLCCPPLYFMAPVFYTDQLTMVFPPLLFVLYLAYSEESRGVVWEVVWTAGFCVCSFIGYCIKPTVFIMEIAVIILLMLCGKWRKLLILLAGTLVVFLICTTIMNGYFYSNHLDKQKAEQMKTPLETWILMGLHEKSGFNQEDTEFSRSIETYSERKTEVRKAIVARAKEYGVKGLYQHTRRKGIQVFADGTFELSYSFLFGLQKENDMLRFLTTLGEDYDTYWHLCAYIWYSILLLGFGGMLKMTRQIWTQKEGAFKETVVAIPLSMMGLYLFLMMWEVHCRYSVNFYAIFLMMAVFGLGWKRQK